MGLGNRATVHRLGLCSSGLKDRHDLGVTLLSGSIEGSVAMNVSLVLVCSGRQQALDTLDVTLNSSSIQRSPAPLIGLVLVCSG